MVKDKTSCTESSAKCTTYIARRDTALGIKIDPLDILALQDTSPIRHAVIHCIARRFERDRLHEAPIPLPLFTYTSRPDTLVPSFAQSRDFGFVVVVPHGTGMNFGVHGELDGIEDNDSLRGSVGSR